MPSRQETRRRSPIAALLRRGAKHGLVFAAHVGTKASFAIRRGAPAAWTAQRADVVVSLASHPPRYPTLHLTLKSLLLQDPPPIRVELCLTEAEASQLPASTLALRAYGVHIRLAEDLRSFKKYVPLRRAEPGATIVTADDDVCYWNGWLAQLLAGRRNDREIVAHRARVIHLDARGTPLPYRDWPITDREVSSPLVFPTGVGGILYPPGAHHADVLDVAQFMRLCPTNDDAWFYWMARRQGTPLHALGGHLWLPMWRGTQRVALTKLNVELGANDPQVAAMVATYGFADLPQPHG